MAGISNNKLLWALALLLLSCACIREDLPDEDTVDQGEERFAEYDPVVRFSLDTYLGSGEPLTKTTYAGDDKLYELGTTRYERINWNAKTTITGDGASTYTRDLVQIHAEPGQEFGPNDNLLYGNYFALEIEGRTNPDTKVRTDVADAAPASGSDDDQFYWSLSDNDRRFYAVYPSPEVTNYKNDYYDLAPWSRLAGSDGFTVDKDEHEATVKASINKKEGTDPLSADAPCREQKYLWVQTTTGTHDAYEYMPNMRHAYLYAAAVMPKKDAGYKKVPLRFKPLFSAIKLIVTAEDAGAKDYRLMRVDLRTDLHGDSGTKRLDLNPPGTGTPLGGSFTASFKAGSDGLTGDFTLDKSTIPDADTLKRLFISIPESDRKVLGEDTLKLTFLTLPVEQNHLTVEYIFERRKDPAGAWDAANVEEVHRYLTLQKTGTKNDPNSFQDREWYELPAAHKLYVRSHVPDIRYFFEVQAQGNFPRTWNSGDDIKDGTHYYSDDFYSVQSYRDSSGVKQPMKWKVTGYKNPGDAKFEMGNRPGWLRLRGDDGTWDETQEITDLVHHGWNASGDPWEAPWGAGTPVLNGKFEKDSEFDSHARNYVKGSSFVSYVSAAEENRGGYPRNESLDADSKPDVFEANRDWDVPVSYLCKDLDGKYYYQEDHTHTPSAGWKGLKGEAYAYDLSSHDIYGRLIVPKNGDLGTTANCYVVSAPGWYRFPAVYGCSVKNGGDNKKSYTGSGGVALMGAFLDHNANGITSPAIPGIDEVDVLWDDANHMVAPSTTVSSRADRRPFYHKEPSEPYGYIYFYVDDIAQGNALLVAKSGGIIVWSWHIWAVTKPGTFLKTVGLESNKKDLAGNDNPYQSIYGTNYMWQKTDLGQHGSESGTVGPRYCDVEFTQYFRGKVVKKVVVRFLQSGVKDGREEPIFFQWGRKDPFPKDKMGLGGTTTPIALTTENTHETIKKPDFFYGGSAEYVPTGKRYDNLWNTNIDKAPTEHYSDGSDDGSLDRKVEKTIYDPSPPGFHVANMYCLSAFNPISPINETKIPSTDANQLAKAARPIANYYRGIRYYDFYAEYDETVAYKRKVTGETIRFYILGRLAAGSFNADKPNEALYWYSEPAVWTSDAGKILYGRSFWLGSNHPTDSQEWQLYPVAGKDDKHKWQRNHALPVRPMAEGTQPDNQFGGTNMNLPSHQNPF